MSLGDAVRKAIPKTAPAAKILTETWKYLRNRVRLAEILTRFREYLPDGVRHEVVELLLDGEARAVLEAETEIPDE